MNLYIILVIAALFAVTVITRFLPFIFTKQLTKSPKIQALGPKLPAYIMMILLIYQLNPQELSNYHHALISAISLLVVICAHKFLNKPLVSICLGTICYAIGCILLQ